MLVYSVPKQCVHVCPTIVGSCLSHIFVQPTDILYSGQVQSLITRTLTHCMQISKKRFNQIFQIHYRTALKRCENFNVSKNTLQCINMQHLQYNDFRKIDILCKFKNLKQAFRSSGIDICRSRSLKLTLDKVKKICFKNEFN